MERFLLRRDRFILGYADGEEADQLIRFRDVQDGRHLIADPVVVGDMAFVPAALVSQFDDSQQHILDCGGIILHGEALVPISHDPSGQDTDGGGSGLANVRGDDAVELLQSFRIVECDEARRLLIAAGGRGEAGFHDPGEVCAGHGGAFEFASVAVAAQNSIYDIHSDFSFVIAGIYKFIENISRFCGNGQKKMKYGADLVCEKQGCFGDTKQ